MSLFSKGEGSVLSGMLIMVIKSRVLGSEKLLSILLLNDVEIGSIR